MHDKKHSIVFCILIFGIAILSVVLIYKLNDGHIEESKTAKASNPPTPEYVTKSEFNSLSQYIKSLVDNNVPLPETMQPLDAPGKVDDITDSVTIPQDNIIKQELYRQERLVQLNSIISNEPLNPTLSTEAVSILSGNISSETIGGVIIASVDCRTTLCHAVVKANSVEELRTFLREVPFIMPWNKGGFVDAQGNTVSIYFATESHSLPPFQSMHQ